MNRNRIARPAILLTVLALGFASAGGAEQLVISVGGSSSADGDLTFLFKPEQGEEQWISVSILKGTNAKNSAREIRKEFVLALSENYEVVLFGKEKKNVRITSQSMAGAFDLELTNNTVGGLAISIK